MEKLTEMPTSAGDRGTERLDNVTFGPETARAELLEMRPSPLPFDPSQLTAIRVNRAQFARMCRVSKQTVSQWARKGWITVGADDRFDPIQATRQLLRHADPSRLRASLFKEAMTPLGELRERLRDLETENRQLHDRIGELQRHAASRNSVDDLELARRASRFIDALEAQADAYMAAHAAGLGDGFLDVLLSEHVSNASPDTLLECLDELEDAYTTANVHAPLPALAFVTEMATAVASGTDALLSDLPPLDLPEAGTE